MLAYHLAIQDELDASAAEYAPSAFVREGFIHLTRRREILHEVANRYYQSDARAFLVLTIDLSLCPSMWRYDLPNDEYPHLYGRIPREAIVHIETAPRTNEGAFLPLP